MTCAYRAQSIFRRTGKRVPILPIFSNLPRWNGQKPSQEFLFAVFGRYHSDMRLSAILDVLTAFPGQKALFIGEAPAFLRSHPQVETTGFLLPEAAAHALHRARFFMLFDKRGISFRKGSSAAALRNGIPVVANHTEWTDPVFQDNVNVAFFDGSVAGAIARIKALLSDPDGCRRIGEEGNRLYEQEMSVHVVVQRIFRLFREART
ncbi:MAG: hypothetical protein A2293_00050 [Elusimicrobia bacterium RIFOXYB2_FULL_49_7]|nr:MAG: hypothetical protein A2293_00050 [Elusimicrobia bacterium RIFOXYB2_FULL_49_7]